MTERHPIYENRFARAALIFGCIAFACLLAALLLELIPWPEHDPLPSLFILTAIFLVTVGPVSALLALIFGCIGRKREREQSPVPSRRYIAFSAAGIISGAITLLTVLIRIVSELVGAGA